MIQVSFRTGLFTGLFTAVALGGYLCWLWQPERQVDLHTEHLLEAVEDHDWAYLTEFVDESYQDQWGNDRSLLLERLRTILSDTRNLRIEAIGAGVQLLADEAEWSARVKVAADESEITAFIKDRVNNLQTPFLFRWRCPSGKPWDWKLVRVSNEALELPKSPY